MQLQLGQRMPGLGGHAPPTSGLNGIRRLARGTGEADHANLISGFTVAGQRRQTQQTHAFFTRAQPDAAIRRSLAWELTVPGWRDES